MAWTSELHMDMADNYSDACLEEGRILNPGLWAGEAVKNMYLSHEDIMDLADYWPDDEEDEEDIDFDRLEAKARDNLARQFRNYIDDDLIHARPGDPIVFKPEREPDLVTDVFCYWGAEDLVLTEIESMCIWVDVSRRHQPTAAQKLGVFADERREEVE